MKIRCIYIIKSRTCPEKSYVGSTSNFNRRKWCHLYSLRTKRHQNPVLQTHVNKYGIEDVHIEILELVNDQHVLLPREQYFLDTLNPSFNISKIAGSNYGLKRSLEVRAARSVISKRLKHTPEAKEKIRQANIGRFIGKKHTPEFCERIRLRTLGNNHIGKKVVDLSTGIIYDRIKDAATAKGLHRSKVSEKLNGRMKNNTSLRLVA